MGGAGYTSRLFFSGLRLPGRVPGESLTRQKTPDRVKLWGNRDAKVRGNSTVAE
jgi:hypothetical protein